MKRIKEGVFKEEIFELEKLERLCPIDTRESSALATKVRRLIERLPETSRSKEPIDREKNEYVWERKYFVIWENDGPRNRGEEVVVTYHNNPDGRTDDTGFLTVTVDAAFRPC